MALAERIQDEQQTQWESSERVQSIVETASDPIIGSDHSGNIIAWNSAAERTFGYSAEEVMNRSVAILMPERFAELHERAMERAVAAGKLFYARSVREVFGRKKDGTEFPVEVSISSWRHRGEMFFTAIIRDITERKQKDEALRRAKEELELRVAERTAELLKMYENQKKTEAELVRAVEVAEGASRAKSEFLANMSHEIRTPINAIIGMSELALQTSLTEEQREYLETVETASNHLLGVINDILDFSRMEAGKLDIISTPFSLRDAVADAMTTIAGQAHAKGLELVYQVQPTIPDPLIGDPGRLRQILVNLGGNAVKFTPAGEISMDVTMDAETDEDVILHFSVSDTGVGIPAEKREKIFQAFEQVDTSMTREFGGTGLGLTISAQLVHMMNGLIWVESELGKGSTFHFTVQFGIQGFAAEAPSMQDVSKLKDVPALVVDDNGTNRRILKQMLLQWGMKVMTVESGPSGLKALHEAADRGEPYSLVVTDVMMPEMDGFEFARRIVEEGSLKPCTIMMLTSAGQRGDAARCMELGIGAYLLKPVKAADLLYTIRTVLDEDCQAGSQPSLITRHSIRESRLRLHILLAEDNVVNQKVATKMLERIGHTVSVASTGKDALDMTAESAFDLVLMDVQMPVMDGLTATKLIRERELATGLHTPILAMTAHAMKGDEEKCLAAGMDGYLSKPIKINELLEAIENMARTSEQEREEAPSAAPQLPILDYEGALERVGGDEELLRDVAGLFVEECPRLISNIEEAIRHKDAHALERSAHELKGAAGNFAAAAVVDSAFKLETMGRSGELGPASRTFVELESKIERLKQDLGAVIRRNEGEVLRGGG